MSLFAGLTQHASPIPVEGNDFEALCARAWAVGCRNGVLNHISPWNEKNGHEVDSRGGVWQTHMPALNERTKAQFREVVREILKGAA